MKKKYLNKKQKSKRVYHKIEPTIKKEKNCDSCFYNNKSCNRCITCKKVDKKINKKFSFWRDCEK